MNDDGRDRPAQGQRQPGAPRATDRLRFGGDDELARIGEHSYRELTERTPAFWIISTKPHRPAKSAA